MAFGAYESIELDVEYQLDADSLVFATLEALGQGGTAFSVHGEVSEDNGHTFRTIAFASVSDFAPPQYEHRRASLLMPVPANVKFRLHSVVTQDANANKKAWVARVG